MATKRDLLAILDASKRKPQSAGYRLRLQLADLLLRQLRAKGWTQKQLAKAARMKESFITRVIHAESNCTFDVAGRLLFAAGVSAARGSIRFCSRPGCENGPILRCGAGLKPPCRLIRPPSIQTGSTRVA